MGLPAIQTPRLLLRPWTAGDVDALHALWVTSEVRRYLWDDSVISREVAAQAVDSHLDTVERHGIGYWALHIRGSPSEAPIAGFCGLRFFGESADIELMYGLRAEHWGKGLATEACLEAVDYLWRSTPFGVLYARTDLPNERSVRLMKRLGMRGHSEDGSMITYVLERPT